MLTTRIIQTSANPYIEIINNADDADYIIINSCTFDSFHEEDTLRYIEEFSNKQSTIILLGCLAAVRPDELNKYDIKIIPSLKELHTVIGEDFDIGSTKPMTNAEITKTIKENLRTDEYFSTQDSYDPGLLRFLDMILSGTLSKNRRNRRIIRLMKDEMVYQTDESVAEIEISRGCNFRCSYCIIKKARGPLASREPEEILSDIESLSGKYEKFRLVSDDCGSYGQDIGTSFLELMEGIHDRFPDKKINIHYLHPYWVEKNFSGYAEMFKEMNITSLNISAQHFSKKVLKSMNRPNQPETILNLIEYLRRHSPQTVIISFLILGYPTENLFGLMKTLVNSFKFDISVWFKYTPRIGTPAYDKYGNKTASFINFKFRIVLFIHRVSVALKFIDNIIKGKK